VVRSEELAEFIDGEAGVADDPCHSNGIDGVVPRDCNFANAVRHDDVFGLSQDPKPGLFQGPNCPEMIDSGQLRHN
jgi:hypothetical protein